MPAATPQHEPSPHHSEKEKTMSNYSNPALEAELAYRREQLRASAGRSSRSRRWFPRRRPAL
jgi:hypothetical protein